jgi:hypothetical protein
MDLKLRIIIAFFSAIALFYICQFIISYMSKKEHFSSRYYDDVEKYEDAPAATSRISDEPNESSAKADSKSDNYDLRIFLLQQIDTLNITDSKVKASLMEKLFTPDSMSQLKPMSNEQRIQKVNDVFHEVQGHKTAEKTVEVDTETDSLHNQIKNSFNTEKEKLELPQMKDYFENDFNNRINKASDKLDNVIEGLTDLKDILKGSNSKAKEQYIPDLPVPPAIKVEQKKTTGPPVTSTTNAVASTVASTNSNTNVTAPTAGIERYTDRSIASLSAPPILSQAAGLAAPSQLIEGFENIRSYALY